VITATGSSRRRLTAAAVAAVVVVGLVVGGLASARSDQDTTLPDVRPEVTSSESSPPPAFVNDCWVPASTGNISLSGSEAMDLTTTAATVAETRRGQERLLTVVERTLALPPDQTATVAASLLGDTSTDRLTCSYARVAVEPEDAGPSGLTPRARQLRAAWTEVFGELTAGGFARGGVSSGHVDSSSHYDGLAVDVFFRPVGDDEQRRRGRVLAQWLVAHAQQYHVLSVIFADQIWTSWAAYAGWREYVHPSGNRTNPVLRHLDHVHVAVESGRPFRG